MQASHLAWRKLKAAACYPKAIGGGEEIIKQRSSSA